MNQSTSTNDKMANCGIENQTDNRQDEEKNRNFVFDLTYKLYENQIKRSAQIKTVIGFALATDGVVFLGMMSFSQFVGISPATFHFINLNTFVIFLSIFTLCISSIASNPILLDPKCLPTEIANQPFKDLHNQIYANLEEVIKTNDHFFRIALILWIIGVCLLSFSIGVLHGSVSL